MLGKGVAGIAVVAGHSARSKTESVKNQLQDIQHQSFKQFIVSPIFHALVMTFSFVILLGTVYTQQQSYRFTGSNLALMRALKTDQIKEINTVEDIWQWLADFSQEVGGDTLLDVEANCGYDPNSQTVRSGGKNYTLGDPAIQYQACSNIDYVAAKGENRDLHMVGNNELLSFGIFTERSTEEKSRFGANGKASEVPVVAALAKALDPANDPKLVKMCDVQWGECVLTDGFESSPGSTFQWPGRVVDGKRAYSTAGERYFLKGAFEGPMREVTPCYSYEFDGGEEQYILTPGNASFPGVAADIEFEGCEVMWVSDGIDIRTGCLTLLNDEPTPALSFAAAALDTASVVDLLDEAFGCNYMMSATPQELRRVVVESDYALRIYLPKSQRYGTFFETSSEYEWVLTSTAIAEMLKMHRFVDRNTRTFRVSVIVRNLGVSDLYYAGINLDISISSTGRVSKNVFISYIPIVQYYYGIDGYSWHFRDVAVFECLFLCIFFVYLLRECIRLYYLAVKRYSAPKIAGAVGAETTVEEQHAEEVGPSTSEIRKEPPVMDLESVSEGDLTGRPQAHHTANIAADPESASREQQNPEMSSANDSNVLRDSKHSMSLFLLDWTTIACITTAIGYRVKIVARSRDLHNYMVSIAPEYDDFIEELLDKFYDLDDDMIAMNALVIIVVFLGITQFFRYMSFSPRLGIVTTTIAHASEDLIPVLIIFVVVLTAYGVLGTSIYGHKLTDWSNLGKSLSSLFIMILGEFGPYFRMNEIKPHETAIFFWSFIVVVLFILFNMVLAVIFTVYDEKQDELKASKRKDKKNI